MNKFYRNVAMALLLAMTAGCGSTYVPLQPDVKVVHRSFTLFYGEDGSTLSLEEQHRMNTFFRGLQPLATEQIRLLVSKKSQDSIAAAAQLRGWLLSEGFTSGTVTIVTTAQPVDELKVLIDYTVARVPENCMNWSDYPPNYHNRTWANYGCASTRNLSAQVDNPRDLVRGHGGKYTDGDLNQVSITKYKTDTVTQTVKDSASGQ